MEILLARTTSSQELLIELAREVEILLSSVPWERNLSFKVGWQRLLADSVVDVVSVMERLP